MTKAVIQLVQLTDLHLFADPHRELRGVPTLASLRATVLAACDDIAACDAILATGDLVQDDPAAYPLVQRELGALGRPVLCLPGNHDDVAQMQATLAAPPFQCGGTWDAGEWRVILLDSTVPGEPGGRLAAAELERLDAALAAAPDRHALVCLHHHPAPLHSRWIDGIGLANAAGFHALLAAHGNVRAVVFGHVHQAFAGVVQGVQLIGTPSTCAQFRPNTDRFVIDDRPPAWRTLRLHADGRIDTQLNWVDWSDSTQAQGATGT